MISIEKKVSLALRGLTTLGVDHLKIHFMVKIFSKMEEKQHTREDTLFLNTLEIGS
jgi:hypothetical protein